MAEKDEYVPTGDPYTDPFLQKPSEKNPKINWYAIEGDGDATEDEDVPKIDRGPSPTTVRCLCGKVGYTVINPRMRTRFSCCCVDCRQAHDACAVRGGRAIADGPRDLAYFDNDVEKCFGGEHVRLERLRKDDGGCGTPALSLRAVATCCSSVVAVDHDAYKFNCFMVPTEGCVVTAPLPLAPQKRIFVGDWDAKKDGPPPAKIDAPENPYPTTPFNRPPPAREGAPIQLTPLWRGKKVHFLGLKEGSRDLRNLTDTANP